MRRNRNFSAVNVVRGCCSLSAKRLTTLLFARCWLSGHLKVADHLKCINAHVAIYANAIYGYKTCTKRKRRKTCTDSGNDTSKTGLMTSSITWFPLLERLQANYSSENSYRDKLWSFSHSKLSIKPIKLLIPIYSYFSVVCTTRLVLSVATLIMKGRVARPFWWLAKRCNPGDPNILSKKISKRL